MIRLLLPVAMLVSLWPVGFIALSFATDDASNGSTEVQVTVPSDPSAPSSPPKTATVRLKVGGKTYSCPTDIREKLAPIDQRTGELELKIRTVRRELRPTIRRLKQLDKLYPGDAPTEAIADEYNDLLRKAKRLEAREGQLVEAFNSAVGEHNGILDSDCY